MKPQETSIEFNKTPFTLFIRDDVDQSVMAEIFKWREYRCADDIIKNQAHPTIIDVGAHAGFFSLYSYALNRQAVIYSLEPEPNNFSILKKHLQKNNITSIIPKMEALAAISGPRKLAVSDDSHNHQLSKLDAQHTFITVMAVSFSDFCRQNKISTVSLLKLDIEGAEYEIFSNLDDADYSMIENIVLEYHNYDGHNFKEIEFILRNHGFSVETFPSQFDIKMGFLLARNKKRAA